jgi:hypothetical protein
VVYAPPFLHANGHSCVAWCSLSLLSGPPPASILRIFPDVRVHQFGQPPCYKRPHRLFTNADRQIAISEHRKLFEGLQGEFFTPTQIAHFLIADKSSRPSATTAASFGLNISAIFRHNSRSYGL